MKTVALRIQICFWLFLWLTACSQTTPAVFQPDLDDQFLGDETVRLLVVGDPFAIALQNAVDDLSRMAGGKIDIEVVGYDDARELTLANARDAQSAYDVVSFDVVWLGEYGSKNVLLPLDYLLNATPALETDDFLQAAYRASQYQQMQYGLPIQPHPELLWYRQDLFEAANLSPPQTTADVLHAAAVLHNPAENLYGICWNGQQGQPLGQQMAHFYGAFGQPLLNEAGRPTLNTPQGLAAARYAQALLSYSPPDILSMSWDQRARRLGRGGCAMTYGWAARIYQVEDSPIPKIHGNIRYIGAPHAPTQPAVTPLGVWSLGIPANIGSRQALAWNFLAWLSSSKIQTLLAEHGNGGMPRYSVITDADLQQRYPAFEVTYRLDQADELADWMRPPIPQWPALANILGTTYHEMLEGKLTPEEAAAQAQAQAEALFEASKR